MKITFSTLAVKLLQQENPAVCLTGFAPCMKRLISELEGETTGVDAVWRHNRPGFIPDAFYIDRKKQEVVMYEVEDTHLLSIDKLRRMIIFYFWLDTHYWILRVKITNRYGQVTNEVDLFRYLMALESPPRNPVPPELLTRRQLKLLAATHPIAHESFIKKCLKENKKKANNAMEPTRPTVTDRANARSAPVGRAAHLGR
jgi:hypothetical protein